MTGVSLVVCLPLPPLSSSSHRPQLFLLPLLHIYTETHTRCDPASTRDRLVVKRNVVHFTDGLQDVLIALVVDVSHHAAQIASHAKAQFQFVLGMVVNVVGVTS